MHSSPSGLTASSRAGGGYELPADATEKERRRALAEWIVSPENPLTPRVLVNRLWHYHFGAGIVARSGDGFAEGEHDPTLFLAVVERIAGIGMAHI